jgi:hypothetical protein
VPPGSSLIEIDLIDREPDGTLLRMTHRGLPDAEACANHEKGWRRRRRSGSRLQPQGSLTHFISPASKG